MRRVAEILIAVGRRDPAVVPARSAIEPVDQGREALSAAPARTLYRAWRQALPDRPGDADRADAAFTILQLAGRLGCGAPRDNDALAPSRMEIVLAAELPTRSTADSPAYSGPDSLDRERESLVG
jgi:hypothetical protein